MKRVILMGNPNVGKSVVFSQLTGASVTIANYPGTTVEFSKGALTVDGKQLEIIDAPGTYSIHNESPAEQVAANVVKSADVVINVCDATNLERNLYLTHELLEQGVNMVVVLNMIDEATRKGINIDANELSEQLGVPVIATVALEGRGIKELVDELAQARAGEAVKRSADERWQKVGQVVTAVQTVGHRHYTWLERLQDASLRPLTGLPLALLVVGAAVSLVVMIGGWMEDFLEDVFFEGPYLVVMERISGFLGGSGIIHDLLIGQLIDGEICFEESLGVLTTGVFVEFGIVLPFLVLFYIVLGVFEDVGFMPRLAVLVDRFMHRLGLHGFAIIPMMLGFGCNVPAALSVRSLESRRERFIACTLVAICIPCMAQLAMIVALVGRYGLSYLGVVVATLIGLWIVMGVLLDRMVPGFTPSMVLEIPPYRVPRIKTLAKKLWMRTVAFLVHATPWILGGVAFVNALYFLGIIDRLAYVAAPVVSGLFGLPAEAVSAMLVGFLRKDVAVAMLEPIGMTARQMTIGSALLAVYFPCAATFAVLSRELGARDLAKSAVIMVCTAVVVGTLLNLLLDRVFSALMLSVVIIAVAVGVSLVLGGASERREFVAESDAN